ncbi:ornithine cyclodeaminase family protein [Paraburkholderia sp. Tr-20389]|uniref:ornithine cyclodeaminase family protein n=1 Tax=Paraburkholderia sp. Tr-20389 TaxID=2703903 RepID=UPI00198036E6|nr:ornithine cyclodeaminase family protein [Paraburkholderia sp. Tr-20389]MBN3756743.1 ornithine cyclodeaminase family protein [Paraburkholderia sp. Tr-20389]
MPNNVTLNATLLLLNKDDVEQLLTVDDVLAAVQRAFVLHSEAKGRVFPVVRESLATGGVFGIKSGDVQAEALLGFKAAGFWPSNRALGGEPHQATVMLVDPATGRPRCVIDGNAITTMRTGAAGGLGLQQLARADSESLCVFGTGTQARIQLTYALHLLRGLKVIRYVTSHGEPDAAFEALFAAHCEVLHAPQADEAVAQSDIVITATPGGGPLFSADAVRAGTHINCVGADTKGKRELPEGLLERAQVYVDDRMQASQIGELQWRPDVPSVEIGALVGGAVKAGRARDDITIFDMTGLALQDLTVAQMLLDRATDAGIGTRVAWPW